MTQASLPRKRPPSPSEPIHPLQPPVDNAGGRPKLNPEVLKLGFVSFLTDLSTEAIFSVFAVFFTTVAGASSALLGLIEGLADFSASSLNYLAGWLSDRSGRRKVFALAGYGFSTLAKTILLVSSTVVGLSAFRVIERLGKGFRGPPRDAWLSSLADPATRGYSFGVHKALDKAGAVFGPLLAYALLRSLGESARAYRTLFWVAFLPAVASVVVLAMMKDQPGTPHARESVSANCKALSAGFKGFLVPAGVFALGYYSLGFLLLKAHAVGFSLTDTVLLYALFNAVCVVTAPLVGRLGDTVGRRRIVILGYGLYAFINLALIWANQSWQIIALFAVYGVFFAIDESQSKAFIADLEPDRRATAVGAYNFVTGVLYLPASLVAGALWTVDPRWAFAMATALALVAIGLFVSMRPALRHQ
ncbi:MFS transporter [Polaromonas sp.]|uniref:MFS transporter n=1 Tax=Polaromonas sp. TaxID=1869339 RepID=UPI0025E46FA4|nr:MFS transporter [Polaromonas sp.]